MINADSLNAVNASKFNDHFAKPLYDSYCFSQIPQTIYHLLTGDEQPGLPTSVLGDLPHRFDKVILMFVDAFGSATYQGLAPELFEMICAADSGRLTADSSLYSHLIQVSKSTLRQWRLMRPSCSQPWRL